MRQSAQLPSALETACTKSAAALSVSARSAPQTQDAFTLISIFPVLDLALLESLAANCLRVRPA